MNYNDYRIAWENAKVKPPLIPLNIDIELSSACNLNCPFCYHHSKTWAGQKIFMDRVLAQEILYEAHCLGVPAIKFNWRGESTIHPNFSHIIRYAADLNFLDLIVNTNGNWPIEAVDGLMRANKVIISVDSLNPELYKKSRVGGDIKKLKDNIHCLIELSKANMGPVIELRRVITPENKNDNFHFAIRKEFKNDVLVSEHFVFNRSKLTKKKAKRIYCGQPSQRLVISAHGDIFPCCVDFNEEYKLGNINKISLVEAWDSEKMCELREKLRKGKYDFKPCSRCTSFSSYDVPEREALNG